MESQKEAAMATTTTTTTGLAGGVMDKAMCGALGGGDLTKALSTAFKGAMAQAESQVRERERERESEEAEEEQLRKIHTIHYIP